MDRAPSSSRGTVSLVALCFIAVLGIVLASYIAVCTRSMQLSNRSYQAGLGQQLAEFGLEEGLRAFNKNDWGTWSATPTNMTVSAWAFDATNKRASRTITFGAGKLGQGATATVKIRVDNYDAPVLGAEWINAANYRVNNLVGNGGIWYRCVQTHGPSQTPNSLSNLAYWVPEPIPWTWIPSHAYEIGDMVFASPSWRRCKAAHTSGTTFSATNWDTIPSIYSTVLAGNYYYTNEVAYYGPSNVWAIRTRDGYGSDLGGWDISTIAIAWRWTASKMYSYGDVVYDSDTWYRYIYPTAASNKAINDPTPYWENALAGSMFAWSSSGIKYNMGDAVYYSATNRWYRCIRANTSTATLTPTNTAYWADTPAYSVEWDAGRQYAQSDLVRYKGVWYYCRTAHNNQTPPTASPYFDTYWASTDDTTRQWNAVTNYTAGTNYVSYDGVWYKCALSNIGQTPNNSTCWTAAWANSAGVTTGAPVVYVEAAIALPNNPVIRTQIRANLGIAPLFPNAVGASTTLTVGGAGGTVDSYDSGSSSSYASQIGTSTNYSAVLAGETSITINGNTSVKGYLAWPTPIAGISTGTTVKGPIASLPNIDSTRISRSPYVPQFESLPTGGLSSAFILATLHKGSLLRLPSGTANTMEIGTPGGTTPSRYYYNGNLTISDSAAIRTLNINGPVILYISGDLILDGDGASPDGSIVVTSTGSAEIHVGDSLMVAQNSDGIRNQTSDPKKLTIICDTSANSIQYYGDGGYALYGTLYFPNTASSDGLRFNNTISPSSSTYAVYGAVSAKKVTYDNSMNVHYDTSLRYSPTPGVYQPYAVTEWRELPIAEAATMP